MLVTIQRSAGYPRIRTNPQRRSFSSPRRRSLQTLILSIGTSFCVPGDKGPGLENSPGPGQSVENQEWPRPAKRERTSNGSPRIEPAATRTPTNTKAVPTQLPMPRYPPSRTRVGSRNRLELSHRYLNHSWAPLCVEFSRLSAFSAP